MIVDYFKLSSKDQLQATQNIKNIFFESSSRKEFKDESEKENFFRNWTSYYLEDKAQPIWLWQNELKITQSYLMGTFDSSAARTYYHSRIPSYLLFEDLFAKFPAHLHINSSSDVRGQGHGSKLIQHFLKQLKELKINGVHLITGPSERNVAFYEKNGFSTSIVRAWKGSELLFLGQELARA